MTGQGSLEELTITIDDPPMTDAEYNETRARFAADRRTAAMVGADMGQLWAYYKAVVATCEREQDAYDRAVAQRPAYAPQGQPTRSEAGALAVVWAGRRWRRYVAETINRRLATAG